jgi:hypothetical protein
MFFAPLSMDDKWRCDALLGVNEPAIKFLAH